MEGYRQKEGGTRRLEEWIISGKASFLLGDGRFYQVDYLPSVDQEIPD